MKNEYDNLNFTKDFEENLNNCIVLTGAGFSKGFGGLVANEIWSYLYNDPALSNNIRKQLIQNPDKYEDSYHYLNSTDVTIYNDMIRTLFKLMDENLLSKFKNDLRVLDKLFDFIHKKNKYNFIFSLNQDLLVERYFMSKNRNDTPLPKGEPVHGNCKVMASEVELYFPYSNYSLTKIIRSMYNRCFQDITMYSFDTLTKEIKFNRNTAPTLGGFNYIKLHGSYNWNHKDGTPIAATGVEKGKYIENIEVLKSYLDLFKFVLKRKTKILFIGYGYLDDHINELIEGSINDYGTELFLVQPETYSKLSEKDFIKNNSEQIRGIYPIKIRDLLNSRSKYSEKLYSDLVSCLN